MTDNLPPLPKGDITYHITDSVMRQMECDAHSDRQIQAYARAIESAVAAPLLARIAALEAQVEQAAQPVVDFAAFEAAVQEYIEDYEMLGETEDGRDACYTPNENDKALLLDAFMGFDFSQWRAPSPPMKAADEFELRRLLAEERETTRQLNRALRNATEGPVFMGEPSLYTAPPKAVPLTEIQINDAYGSAKVQWGHIPHFDVVRIVRAVEAAHGIGTPATVEKGDTP